MSSLLNFQFNAPFWGGALVIAGSIFLWFVYRVKSDAKEFPILRVLNKKSSFKPLITLLTPPLIPFVCFLLTALSFLLFLTKPAVREDLPNKSKILKTHIFLDLSPSVSSKITLDDYFEKLFSLVGELENYGNLSFSSTHSSDIWKVSHIDHLKEKFFELGFHRSGAKLGSSFHQQWPHVRGVERILIVSDGDAYSWDHFNWKYIEQDIDLQFINIGENYLSDQNIFVASAKKLANTNPIIQEWDVVISRSGNVSKSLQGHIQVLYKHEVISKEQWSFDENQTEVTIRIVWSHNELSDDSKIDDNEMAIFKIIPDRVDSLSLDNEFRFYTNRKIKKVLIIAQNTGEQKLETPTHSIQASLNSLGLVTKRIESLDRNMSDAKIFPLWISLIGNNSDMNATCPSRLISNIRQDQFLASEKDLPITVWLIPIGIDALVYQNICWCYHNMMIVKEANSLKQQICKNISSRQEYLATMEALGTKQLGGRLGDVASAIAWRSYDNQSKISTSAFTIPLRPNKRFGLSHQNFPLLSKQLIELNGMSNLNNFKRTNWFRIDNNALHDRKKLNQYQKDLMKLSNVPIGESLQKRFDRLPLEMSRNPKDLGHIVSSNRTSHNPNPWLIALSIFTLVMIFGELLLTGFKYRKQILAIFKLTIVLFVIPLEKSYGQINLSILTNTKIKYHPIFANEINNRTSLTVNNNVLQFKDLSPQTLEQPWLWALKKHMIIDHEGAIHKSLGAWVKRGGLLIIENMDDQKDLEQLTKSEFQFAKNAHWEVIPPDHELMRSFYLLNSLPNCQDGLWKGFTFDDRLAILAIPYSFITPLIQNKKSQCKKLSTNYGYRILVNILMVALTTDYKKDQIHMKEILKRLR